MSKPDIGPELSPSARAEIMRRVRAALPSSPRDTWLRGPLHADQLAIPVIGEIDAGRPEESYQDAPAWFWIPEDALAEGASPRPNPSVRPQLRTSGQAWSKPAQGDAEVAARVACRVAIEAARIPGVAQVRIGARGGDLGIVVGVGRSDWWRVIELLEGLLGDLRQAGPPFDYEVVALERIESVGHDLRVVLP